MSGEVGEKKLEEKIKKRELELEELRIIKDMVSSILEKIGVVAMDVVNAIMSSLDGKKLSQEIAEFYKTLKSTGLPDQVVEEMVKDFYKKKLEMTPSMDELVRVLSNLVSRYREEPGKGKEKKEETEKK